MRRSRRRWLRPLIAAAVLLLLLVGGYGFYLANLAGELPWQEDPTRVSTGITPFADIPSVGAPSPTPAP